MTHSPTSASEHDACPPSLMQHRQQTSLDPGGRAACRDPFPTSKLGPAAPSCQRPEPGAYMRRRPLTLGPRSCPLAQAAVS
jgi:hypothetical protein